MGLGIPNTVSCTANLTRLHGRPAADRSSGELQIDWISQRQRRQLGKAILSGRSPNTGRSSKGAGRNRIGIAELYRRWTALVISSRGRLIGSLHAEAWQMRERVGLQGSQIVLRNVFKASKAVTRAAHGLLQSLLRDPGPRKFLVHEVDLGLGSQEF